MGADESSRWNTGRRGSLSSSGALAVLIVALSPSFACELTEEPPRLVLGGDTIQLERGTRIHEIRLRGGTAPALEPTTVEAGVGDVVRFEAADRLQHVVRFHSPEISAEARTFLESTGQQESPPLLDVEAVWVVSLADAPPGDYPFHCIIHDTQGRLTVSAGSNS